MTDRSPRRSPTVSRLGAFALVLAGSFATAYAVGEQLPGHSHADSGSGDHGADDHGHGSDSHGDTAPTPRVRSADDLGYSLVVTGDRTFRLERPVGTAVTAFDDTHGALLHVVLVRPDLSDFHHIHPVIGADGSWTVELPAAGPWHVVAEAQPTGASRAIVVAADVGDPTGFAAAPLPPANDTVEIDGLRIVRDDTGAGLTFIVTPSEGLEPYLGMPAHLVVVRDGDLAFAHLHAVEEGPGRFSFEGSLPPGATYRAYLQFGNHGQVVTAPFTVVR